MKYNDDELIQNYFDGDLSDDQKKHVENLVSTNKEFFGKFKAYKSLHNALLKTTTDTVPSSFAASVMMRIRKPSKSIKQSNYFFIGVISFFGLISALIFGYIVSLVIQLQPTSNTETMFETTSRGLYNVGEYMLSLFSSLNLSVLGSALSVGVLLAVYFFYENFRNLKSITGNWK